jgi:hypothetical protein
MFSSAFIDDILPCSSDFLATEQTGRRSQRKCVSFNDIPIVYELPSNDDNHVKDRSHMSANRMCPMTSYSTIDKSNNEPTTMITRSRTVNMPRQSNETILSARDHSLIYKTTRSALLTSNINVHANMTTNSFSGKPTVRACSAHSSSSYENTCMLPVRLSNKSTRTNARSSQLSSSMRSRYSLGSTSAVKCSSFINDHVRSFDNSIVHSHSNDIPSGKYHRHVQQTDGTYYMTPILLST